MVFAKLRNSNHHLQLGNIISCLLFCEIGILGILAQQQHRFLERFVTWYDSNVIECQYQLDTRNNVF